jgi:hypothetical protein
VLAILDPDEFFLEALSTKGRSADQLIQTLPKDMASTVTDQAKPGMAVAQMYGIGDVVVHKVMSNSEERFSSIADRKCPCPA